MPEDHRIEKPRLFISHAVSDGEFADAVKREVEKVFANGLDVFCTSSPGAISPGSDWLNEIEGRLGNTQAVIAIITPISIERPWLWFEIGATWNRGRVGKCKIYPLCTPEIDLGNLPSPLDRLQALSMKKAQDLKMLFRSLIDQFGFGAITAFKSENITKRIPKYKDVEIKQVDLNERAFYSGKYTGYTGEELMEVIDDRFFRLESEKWNSDYEKAPEEYVFNGKLIHFSDVDKDIELPPGTAKKLLNTVADRYGLEVALETENLVRYRVKPDGDDEEEEGDQEK
jgi:hypothetical protein